MDTLTGGANAGPGRYQAYLSNSSAPLTCFLFALPLFLVYHGGLWWLRTFAGLKWANAVDIAIADGLGRLGMAGPLLSFIAVVMTFLFLHAVSGKVWHCPPAHIWPCMILESLILALPVFMLSRLVMQVMNSLALSAVDGEGADLSRGANLILSCGAGVYEEFFFRVVVMGILLVFLDTVFRVRGTWKYILAATGQALLFAASHHMPGGLEAIHTWDEARAILPIFGFRLSAGLYFAYIYIERGFGIAAGSHAGYDVLVVLLDIFMPLE